MAKLVHYSILVANSFARKYIGHRRSIFQKLSLTIRKITGDVTRKVPMPIPKYQEHTCLHQRSHVKKLGYPKHSLDNHFSELGSQIVHEYLGLGEAEDTFQQTFLRTNTMESSSRDIRWVALYIILIFSRSRVDYLLRSRRSSRRRKYL